MPALKRASEDQCKTFLSVIKTLNLHVDAGYPGVYDRRSMDGRLTGLKTLEQFNPEWHAEVIAGKYPYQSCPCFYPPWDYKTVEYYDMYQSRINSYGDEVKDYKFDFKAPMRWQIIGPHHEHFNEAMSNWKCVCPTSVKKYLNRGDRRMKYFYGKMSMTFGTWLRHTFHK